MSVTISDFWRLTAESQLLTPAQCDSLSQQFGGVKGAASMGNARTLAEWLVSQDLVTRYHTQILLAGRPGPFSYGEYFVVDRIDRGRLAGLFRARHTPTGEPVLLQFLSGPVLQDQKLWTNTALRAQRQIGIVHPNLWRAWELVDLVSFKFLVLEDLQGDTLAELLAQRGPMPYPEACRAVRQAALALSALHQQRIIHGDLGAQQLWLDGNSQIRLLRDPLAAAEAINLSAPDAATRLNHLADYLAPELTQPGVLPTVQSDVYALGCILYQLLSGRPPFSGGDIGTKIRRHVAEQPQPVDQLVQVPPQLAQIVNFLIAKNPAQRTQQAENVANVLAPFVDPRLVMASPPAPQPSTAAFEAHVQKKTAALNAKARQPAAGSAPAVSAVAIAALPQAPAAAIEPVSIAPLGTATGEDPNAASAPSSILDRDKDRHKADNTPWVLGMIGGGILVAFLIVFFASGGGKNEPQVASNGNPNSGGANGVTSPVSTGAGEKHPKTSVKPNPSDGPKTPVDPGTPLTPATPATPVVDAPQPLTFDVVEDDGKLPWASPTSGVPLEFRYVPLSPQLVFSIRPAELLFTPEGPRVLAALGPEFAAAREKWEAAAGVKLEEVEQLIISLHDNKEKLPRPSCVVRLRSSIDLPTRWATPLAKVGEAEVYRANGWSKWAPPKEDGKLFVMAGEDELRDVIERKGGIPTMRKELSRLGTLLDSNRHFTVLVAPNYLITDGRELFSGSRAKLNDPLSWFLDIRPDGGTFAASLSLHCGNSTYVEARVIGEGGKPAADIAKEFRDRLNELPDKIESYVVDTNPAPYWKKVAFRLPQMIRYLHSQMRVGAESNTAILNAYLPGDAAHNLVAASELAIHAAPGGGGSTAVAAPPKEETLPDKLAKTYDLSFPSNPFDATIQSIASDLGFDFEIEGPELQLDGITRQQSIRDFNMKGQPAADVITALVRKANPVTTVKDPSEKDQKLVWVIRPNTKSGKLKEMLVFTTRTAAEKKGYQLPAVFVPKKEEKKK